MADLKALAQERTKMFSDIMEGKVPKRVPVWALTTYEFAVEYAGKDLVNAQWDSAGNFEAIADKICSDFYSDNNPVFNLRFPSLYTILGAKNWVMGTSGFLQHPEVQGLADEDYDAYIAAPYDTILEKVLPRLYKNMDTDPYNRAITLAKAYKCFFDEMANVGRVKAIMQEKYGFGNANFMAGFSTAPFDFVADQLRGFREIMMDVRRHPDKVLAAVEATLPIMYKMGYYNAAATVNGATFIPLHMAPFMRTKDAEKLYWPTLKELCYKMAADGQRSFLFVEQDMMRYLDILNEFPEGSIFWFEYGDPKLAKEKVGAKHVITGFYPVTLLKTGTKEKCIDKAKELIDTLAPGGRYIFSFDKSPITLNSVKVENLKAVLEYVAQNANY